MKKWSWRVASGVAVSALAFGALQAPAQAAPPANDPDAAAASQPDNLPNPFAEQAAAQRADAVDKLLKGQATLEMRGGQRVIKVAKNPADPNSKDKFVLYDVNREEDIFTILTDFGTQTRAGQSTAPGPVHNQIPAPDRVWDGNATDDNSTYWVKDFNQAHYQDLMFGSGESFKDFYLKQSGGRFLAKGDVSNWVTVPFNEARYGSNTVAQSNGYWNYIKDTATAWFDAQKASGKSDAEIATYLKQFDKVDRYDFDKDGNFNEPDGYIDHFQAIHAGEGEEAGGGAQGADAIWSHRWYAFSTDAGKTGPGENKRGGVSLGNSGIWIGDYTTEPENGGLGVFSHEFGHDLGLPDLYDTAGGDNGTGFWTLMSAGSWLNHGTDSIGTTPGYMGAWEKLQLGWLDYKVVPFGQESTVKVGPAGQDVKTNSQAVVVTLPDKSTTTVYNTPHSGKAEWWSGSSDNRIATLSRSVDLTGADDLGRAHRVGPGGHRGGLRLPLRRGLDQRRGHVDAARRPAHRDVGLDPALLGPQRLQGPERPVPVPVRDGRWSLPQGRLHRRRRRHQGRRGRCGRRRRGRCRRVDRVGLLDHQRHGDQGDPALLHRGEPDVHRLRRHAAYRPVQLRLDQHQAGLGGAVPVPERAARQLRGLRVQRQQHDLAPRCGSGAAGRRAARADHVRGRRQAR